MNEKLSYLVWSACDKIDRVVTAPDTSMKEAHEAIQIVRAHLEARAAQTAPTYDPGPSELPYNPIAPPVEPILITRLLEGTPLPPGSESAADYPDAMPELDPALAALI